MSKNGAIFRIVPYSAAQVAATPGGYPIDPAFPVSALANIQPKVVTRSTSTAASKTVVIDVDLGVDTVVDAMAVMHTRFSSAAQWAIIGATNAQGPLALPLGSEPPELRRMFGQTGPALFVLQPTTRENRRFGFIATQSQTVRYIRVYFIEPAAGVVEIGTLLVLQRLAMGQGQYDNFELGSGRRVDDRSQARSLPGGETVIERGGRAPQWRASWSNLTEAHLRELWSLLMEVGTGAPILAAEYQDGSAGQAEALHYGTIQSIDFSERVQLDKQRVELRIQELV
jgi:hypothetical protein